MSQFKISWHGPFNFRSSKGDDGIPDFVEGENYKKVP